MSRHATVLLILLTFVLLSPTIVTASVTWQQIGGPTNVSSLAIDQTNNQIVYVGTSGNGVYKTADGGATWNAINTGITKGVFSYDKVNVLVIDPSNHETVYAGNNAFSGNGFYKTSDGGTSWVTITSDLNYLNISALAIDPNNNQTLYAGTSSGVFKSTNSGTSWNIIASGSVASLALDPANSLIVYAGLNNYGGVKKTTNGGTTWSTITPSSISFTCTAIIIDPNNGKIIYAAGSNGMTSSMIKTTNGGTTWTYVNYGHSSLVSSLTIDPANSQTVYAGTAGSGMSMTADGGLLWTAASSDSSLLDVNTLTVDPTNSQIIYAGTQGGIWKAVVNSPTYQLSLTAVGCRGVTVDFGTISWNGTNGTATYREGNLISLTTSVDTCSDKVFSAWSGDCSGTGPCSVKMNSAKNVAATFVLAPVNGVCGSDNGKILDAPPVNLCSAGEASPLTGAGPWSWSCSGLYGGTLAICSANNLTYQLSTTKAGTGNGTITSNVAGISCGSACQKEFNPGTQVILTAKPDANSVFTGWSGSCTGTSPTCTLEMETNRNTTAHFDLNYYKLSITKTGTGGGYFISSPPGLTCTSNACSGTFLQSTTVTVTADSDPVSVFKGWSGTCTGMGNCQITMSSDIAIQCSFDQEPNMIWDTDKILEQRGDYPFAGIYMFDNLSIGDNVQITSKGVSQIVIKVNNKLSIGENSVIRVRNGYYSSTPTNPIAELTPENINAKGIHVENFYLLENMYGKGGNGGNGCNGDDGKVFYDYYNGIIYGSGGNGGGGGGGGFGGGLGGANGYGGFGASTYKYLYRGYDGISGESNGGYGGRGGANTAYSLGGGNKNVGENGLLISDLGGGSGGGGNGGHGSDGGSMQPYPMLADGLCGGGGGGGGYGGGILSVIANTIQFATNAPPLLLVSGQSGGTAGKTGHKSSRICNNGEDGSGGLLVIQCSNYVPSSLNWNLDQMTFGQHIVPSANGGHGIITGNPQKVIIFNVGNTYQLSVSKAGTGTGTITSLPVGISCGTTCSSSYTNGTTIILTAGPEFGSSFSGWSGACTGTHPTCQIALTGPQSVTANFTMAVNLPGAPTGVSAVAGDMQATVSFNAPSSDGGSTINGYNVISNPTGGVDTSAAGLSHVITGLTNGLSYTFTVTATNSVGTGPASTPSNQITPNHTLKITINGAGSGNINSIPSGIACSSGSLISCNSTFSGNPSVSLTATPDWKSLFASWSGDCNGTGACSVQMNDNRWVTATFNPILQAKLLPPATYYASLQDAYNAAANGNIIKAQVYTFHENLQLNQPVSITLDGGVDGSYRDNIGMTTLNGSLTINSGTLTINFIIIQ